jgi:transposase
MARFKNDDNPQGLFLTASLSEQLLVGTFEWTLNYLIDRMDLSLFEQNYHNDEKGAAAYSPKALLKAILYCYSKGILSSRPIEQACKNNIIVKSLAADNEPDHDTIAAFISMNSEAVKDLFTQVVLQCDELELIIGEMFALDGRELPSNASKEWSGTIGNLKKKKAKLEKHIARLPTRHRELDKSEEAKKIQEPFRKTMGDDRERRERGAEKKYKENLSEKMREKIDNPAYRELYSRRQQIIEPVFSDIEYCKGMDRFTMRGREKVDIQWKLYCIAHNIGKCVGPLGKKYGA